MLNNLQYNVIEPIRNKKNLKNFFIYKIIMAPYLHITILLLYTDRAPEINTSYRYSCSFS